MDTDKKSFTIRIFLTNDEKVCFKSRIGFEKFFNLGSGIENSLNASYIGLNMDGKLTIIPFQHILKIEIDPTQDVLIAHVIRNIESVQE